MAEEMRGRVVGGDGKVAEVDTGYFGGYLKPANLKQDRVDRRLVRHQTGKRKAVVVIRERGGNTVPAVFKSESAALNSLEDRQGHALERRLLHRLGCAARPLRDEADQP